MTRVKLLYIPTGQFIVFGVRPSLIDIFDSEKEATIYIEHLCNGLWKQRSDFAKRNNLQFPVYPYEFELIE